MPVCPPQLHAEERRGRPALEARPSPSRSLRLRRRPPLALMATMPRKALRHHQHMRDTSAGQVHDPLHAHVRVHQFDPMGLSPPSMSICMPSNHRQARKPTEIGLAAPENCGSSRPRACHTQACMRVSPGRAFAGAPPPSRQTASPREPPPHPPAPLPPRPRQLLRCHRRNLGSLQCPG